MAPVTPNFVIGRQFRRSTPTPAPCNGNLRWVETRLPIGFPACGSMFHPVLKGREKRRSVIASVAAAERTRPATPAHPPFALQHTHRGDLFPLGSGVHPLRLPAPPGNSAQDPALASSPHLRPPMGPCQGPGAAHLSRHARPGGPFHAPFRLARLESAIPRGLQACRVAGTRRRSAEAQLARGDLVLEGGRI